MNVQGDFILAPGEKAVICPYNEAHLVTNARLSRHLLKCQRDYEKECLRQGKKANMSTCRFNGKHVLYEPEIKLHEEQCEDRGRVVECIRWHEGDAFKNQLETKKRERSRSPSRRHKRDRERDRSDRGEKKKDRRESIDKIKRRRSRSREATRERSGVVFRDYGHGRGRNDRPDRSERERTDRGDRSESKREQNGDRRKEKKKVEVKEESIWGEDAEDWDAEAALLNPTPAPTTFPWMTDTAATPTPIPPAYNPTERLKSDPTLLYQPQGLSKSERKAYRKERKEEAEKFVDFSYPGNQGGYQEFGNHGNYEEFQYPREQEEFRREEFFEYPREQGYPGYSGPGYDYPPVAMPPPSYNNYPPQPHPLIKKEPVWNPEPVVKQEFTRRAPPPPPPPPEKIKKEISFEKEDGEISEEEQVQEEEEFVGEDPFS